MLLIKTELLFFIYLCQLVYISPLISTNYRTKPPQITEQYHDFAKLGSEIPPNSVTKKSQITERNSPKLPNEIAINYRICKINLFVSKKSCTFAV